MRSTRTALVAVFAALAMLAPSVGATDAAISVDEYDRSTGAVAGTVVFPAVDGAQSVGGQKLSGPAGGSPAGNAAGLNLTDATITRIANGLRFTWHVAEMPPQVPPEGVRYNWAFKIGARVFQLQAKRTNMANATTLEDPVGHVQHFQTGREFFQLRGSCTTAYLGTPIQGCYHLAFLNGGFDIDGKKITIDLPYETKDSIGRLVAAEFKPGVALEDNGGDGSAGMTIAASFQAVVSNTQTSQYLNSINPYWTAPAVHVGVAPTAANPSTVAYSTPATVEGGRFSAVGPKPNANQSTFVRACNGVTCVFAKADG